MGKVASLIGLPLWKQLQRFNLAPTIQKGRRIESTTVSRDKWGLHCTLFYRGANAALFSKAPSRSALYLGSLVCVSYTSITTRLLEDKVIIHLS